MKPELNQLNFILEHHSGFRERHAIIKQTYRVVEIVNNTFESKKYYIAGLLDV